MVKNGEIQSPALGVLHEFGHALHDLENNSNFIENSSISIPLYHDKEEQITIDNIETPAALKLGEPIRKNHGGKAVLVPTPTYNRK